MEFGRGFSIPMENSWVPITPQKSIPVKPSMIPVDSQPAKSNSNWGELLGIYTGFLQENPANADVADQNFNSTTVFNGENQGFDPNFVGSYVDNFDNQNAAWSNNPLAELLMQNGNADVLFNRPKGVTPYTQFDAASSMLMHQNLSMGSNQKSILQQMPSNGFQVPYCTNDNRYSPPKSVGDAASSVTNPFPFTPVTPDQAKQLQNQRLSEIANHLIDDCSSHEKDRQLNLAISVNGEIENHYEELLQNIVDSSSVAVSKTATEKDKGSDEGRELEFDLNKTPDQKTPAKRRKHRPKVVKEVKPKTTGTPTGPKKGDPKENSTGKRKYVRRTGVKVSADSENPGGVNDGTEPAVRLKSCRRALNFDLENGPREETGGQEETNRGRGKGFNLNLDCQEDELNEVETEGQNGYITENNNRTGYTVDLNCPTNEMPGGHTLLTEPRAHITENNNGTGSLVDLDCSTSNMAGGGILLAEPRAPLTPQVKPKDRALNLIARNLSSRNLNPCEIFLRADTATTSPNARNNGLSQCRGTSEILLQTETANFNESRGSKRHYCCTIEQIHPRSTNTNTIGSPILHVGENNGVVHNTAAESLETHKKMKTAYGYQEPDLNTTRAKDYRTGNINGAYVNKATSQINGRLLNSYLQRENVSAKLVNGVHGVGGERRIYPVGPTWVEEERLKRGPTRVNDLNSLTALTNWTQQPSTPIKASSKNHYIKGGEIQHINDMHANKGNVGPTSCNQRPGGGEKVIPQQHKDASDGPRKSLVKSRGKGKQKEKALSIDEITHMLLGLHINSDGQEQNAIVPYKGDNRIVPYEEFDPIKKRKKRPKVDLDPETDRIWRLLMGKEGSQGTEATDKSKEKWWENERNVFRGRADSFIARMHLVQGDRRFSRWKGSVVDSVIGVFLTQNVSDHLSSSAFMCLAAKFPPPSKSTNKSLCYNGVMPFVEEPKIHMPNLGQIQRQPMIRPSYITMQESLYDQRTHHLPSWTRTAPIQIGSTRNYSGPTISQTTEDIGSSSGSNFEAEDRTIGFRPTMVHRPTAQMLPQFYIHRAPTNYNILHMQDSSASSQNFQSNKGGMQSFGNVGEESTITSLSRQAVSTTHVSRSTSNQQQRMLSFQSPYMGPFLSRIPAHQGNIKWQENRHSQHSINHHQNSSIAERILVPDEKNLMENNNSSAANGREEISSSGKRINGRKGKAEDEKNKAIDWDILRKQAQLNGKKERSKDSMDSLDYEALRSADVSEISNTIKERGMNNMLAERMKDFLDRMVREHGSIDLEWLRDVPPDKAKDYLLSVRGLGLKSVECVRLLTLHHLAFPVDTNVGRIAVRLGWVPLQPLPESLQLHLLELYPVLESIQKYLWPRLCKLDQRTLYELHYQMITFGKVFCTKSKPNCNACPMRGECRHFASAFASARLALPGPEEKSIVSSAVPLTTDKTPPLMTRPLALPPTENGSNKEVGPTTRRNCEPIIEEPATPEPETIEITESDIEDAFYEDSDEIPEIKLGEFAENLHNYMQMQDGDMSKALIALNPEAASIPTPKLKNVNRLRTEHLVYVLPDGHSLLKGLDTREPDDPSPYLLAIWTPGETANSFQPPESDCRSRETGIRCDDEACFSCNCLREANSQTVRGTILIPCRTAMRGSFPLNGTYFQVNEMFADHESSINPIDVPRAWIWNLRRRTVYFGTSVSTIFKGLSTEGIQHCFWHGFVCVRGFDLKTRAPKPLMARLHFPASKLVRTKNEEKQKIALDSSTANHSR